ncbi:hypothetical protein I4F81_011193 [Pyropia yezoensis]|uniref:Uncharacterized protein n=1 Tax=Pyropia yezoensis TaxID=2788 RepID=A0ACC3CER2_PYRYE|nr:hypothetical protein I4F81_011193 [Neopyropia yezoensis]
MTPPPSDGARCAVATCGDWQLLPVRCGACNALHCTAHAAPHAHACAAAAAAAAAYDAIACPACGVALLPPSARTDDGVGWGGGADAVVAAHLDAGCPQGRRAAAAAVAAAGAARGGGRGGGGGRNSGGGGGGSGLPPPSTPYTRCGRRGCSVRTPVAVACGGCGGDFCITHRLEVDHGCDRRRRPAGGAATAAATAASRRSAAVEAARTVRPHRQAAAPALTASAAAAATVPGAAATAAAAKPRRTGRPRAAAPPPGSGGPLSPRNTPAMAVTLASTPGDTLTVVVYPPLATGEAPLHAALPLRATVGVALDGLEAALPRLAAARTAAGVRRWGVWAVGPGGGVQRLPHMGVAATLVAARVLDPGVALVVDAPDEGAGGGAEAAPLPDAWAPLLPALVAATAAGAAGGAGGGGRSGLPLGRSKKGLGMGGKASSSSACRVS